MKTLKNWVDPRFSTLRSNVHYFVRDWKSPAQGYCVLWFLCSALCWCLVFPLYRSHNDGDIASLRSQRELVWLTLRDTGWGKGFKWPSQNPDSVHPVPKSRRSLRKQWSIENGDGPGGCELSLGHRWGFTKETGEKDLHPSPDRYTAFLLLGLELSVVSC